ncbi:MAG: hypothetical protein ACI4ET_04855 [Bilifractor sp.]
MNAWHYTENDGNPKKEGYYLVVVKPCVTFTDHSYDEGKPRIVGCDQTVRGVCYWDGEKWRYRKDRVVGIDDDIVFSDLVRIYAWADVILPANYYLTEGRLMCFLKDYKLSFERKEEIQNE